MAGRILVSDIDAEVFAVTPSSTVVEVSTSSDKDVKATVNYVSPIAVVSVDEDPKNKTIQDDQSILRDALYFALSNRLSDVFAVDDSLSTDLTFLRDFDETIYLGENLFILATLFRGLSDSFSISDAVSFSSNGVRSDSISVSEAIAVAFGLVKADIVYASDGLSLLIDITATDSASISESIAKAMALIKSDSVSASEASRFDLSASKSDSASVGESAAKLFSTNKSDSAFVSEASQKTYGLGKTDSVSSSESSSFDFGATKTDSISLSDQDLFSFGAVKLDSLSASDALVNAFGSGQSDSVSGSESFAFSHSSLKSDSASVSEDDQKLFAKTLADTGSQSTPGGVTSRLISVPAQNSSVWTQRTANISSYIGKTVRLVILYQSGSSFTGDVQLDDFNIGGNTFDPISQNFEVQTTADNSQIASGNLDNIQSDYDAVSWTTVGTNTAAYGFFVLDAGGTPSGSTGLTSGNTGSYYYYAETSSSGSLNDIWIRSPEVTVQSSTLSFYTAQYGATCGPIYAYLDVVGEAGVSPYVTDSIDVQVTPIVEDSSVLNKSVLNSVALNG